MSGSEAASSTAGASPGGKPAAPNALLATGAALLFCFLWAAAFVAAKVAVQEVPPLSLLAVRFVLAGLVLAPLAVLLRSPWPDRALWPSVIGLGLLTNAIYLGLTFTALRFSSAGLGAVIASTNPLILAAVAPVTIGERPSRTTLLGLVIGFLGVVVFMLPRLGGGQDTPFGAALFVVAVVSLVSSTVLFKRLPPGAGLLAITAGQLVAAGLALLPFAVVFEQVLPHVSFSADGWLAFLFLTFGLSIGASLLWFWLLAHGEATRVSAWFFLTPVIGIGLGSLVLGESFGLRELPGLVAVTVGIVLANRESTRSQPDPDNVATK